MDSLEIGMTAIVILGFAFIALIKYQEKNSTHSTH